MAHLSGSFFDANAGTLEIRLEGTFWQGSGRDAGFPSGTSNMLLRGIVGSYRTASIDRYAPTVTFTVAYPGGNVVWPLGTEELAHESSGVSAYGFINLRMTVAFTKR